MKASFRWLVSLFVAFVFLGPLIWMVQGSLLPEDMIFTTRIGIDFPVEAFSFQNFVQAWDRAVLGQALVNSLLQVIGIIGIGLIVNSMTAFAFARLQFRGRDLLFAAVVALIILPVEVLVIPLFLTVRDFNLTGDYLNVMAALIIPFSAKAMNIFFLRQHFLSLPIDTEEAALMDGAGWFRIYWNVALPSIRPALSTVIVLDVITHWSDFIWPLVVCTREETRTVQIALANLFTQPPVQWGDILACAVMLTLPVLLIFRFAQKYVVLTANESGGK